MINLQDYFLGTRLFQSRRIDELQRALSEDDDGPDGGGQVVPFRRKR